jgi:hypothetical protein
MTVAELIAKLQTFPSDAVIALVDEDTEWTILGTAFDHARAENRVYLSAAGGYPNMEKPA